MVVRVPLSKAVLQDLKIKEWEAGSLVKQDRNVFWAVGRSFIKTGAQGTMRREARKDAGKRDHGRESQPL